MQKTVSINWSIPCYVKDVSGLRALVAHKARWQGIAMEATPGNPNECTSLSRWRAPHTVTSLKGPCLSLQKRPRTMSQSINAATSQPHIDRLNAAEKHLRAASGVEGRGIGRPFGPPLAYPMMFSQVTDCWKLEPTFPLAIFLQAFLKICNMQHKHSMWNGIESNAFR